MEAVRVRWADCIPDMGAAVTEVMGIIRSTGAIPGVIRGVEVAGSVARVAALATAIRCAGHWQGRLGWEGTRNLGMV